MYRISDVFDRCNNDNIKAFVVRISADIIEKSIKFDNIDDFFIFVKLSDVNHVYVMQVYEEIDDYLISEETMEEVLGRYSSGYVLECIASDIDKYNEKISKLQLDYPTMIFVACAYEGQMFFTCLENEISFDGEELYEPTDVLEEILAANKGKIQEIKENRQLLIDEQKEALKEYILNDKDFYLSTNQHLRYTYTQNLYIKKLGKKYAELKEFWSTPYNLPTKGMVDFVEMLWREYGKNKMKS